MVAKNRPKRPGSLVAHPAKPQRVLPYVKRKSASRTRRRSISLAVKQMVLLEACYKCANPTCRELLTLELHHIDWVKDGGGNDPINLLALCANCHERHTRGFIPKEAILGWKSMLVTLGNVHRGSIDLLLLLSHEQRGIEKLPDNARRPFRFTGDSLPALAPLLISDLIRISERFAGGGFWAGAGAHPSFEVELTEKGKRLIRAWESDSGTPPGR